MFRCLPCGTRYVIVVTLLVTVSSLLLATYFGWCAYSMEAKTFVEKIQQKMSIAGVFVFIAVAFFAIGQVFVHRKNKGGQT